jgi:hypothetical protein
VGIPKKNTLLIWKQYFTKLPWKWKGKLRIVNYAESSLQVPFNSKSIFNRTHIRTDYKCLNKGNNVNDLISRNNIPKEVEAVNDVRRQTDNGLPL